MVGLTIIFLWIAAHVWVRGNETADTVEKKMTSYDIAKFSVPISKTEAKSIIKQKQKDRLQNQWELETKGRCFYRVQKKGEMRVTRRKRRDETDIKV